MSLEHSPAREKQPKLTGTVGEAAALLGVSRNLAYALVRSGEIPARRMGARIIVLWQPFLRILNGDDA